MLSDREKLLKLHAELQKLEVVIKNEIADFEDCDMQKISDNVSSGLVMMKEWIVHEAKKKKL